CITTHIKVDGDGLGSELALKRAFENINKKVKIINDSKVPSNLSFMLLKEDEVEEFDEEKHSQFIEKSDLLIVVDVALLYRLGKVGEVFKKSKAKKVCIDHHLEGEEIFDAKLVEPNATSTGELVFKLLKQMKINCCQDISKALFTAIVVDSGSLSYERCTPETYRTAAELVECGASPYDIHLSLHWKKSVNQLKMEEEVISNLSLDGDIAYSVVKHCVSKELQIDPMELPDLVHIPLSLENAEIALLFIENGGDEIKVSARSKGKVKICDLAKTFGGGGHCLAAGFVVDAPLEQAIPKVLKKTKEVFEM
ncbi:MAG: bifunctional oligoribonuclease/PAP phosphatase NrnA, partial [Acidobacteria bacterium]|nr:bifunctional oligoribonuclease/PAP phosphatase NrnA [Acidobacteriota bacterium]